MDKLAGNLSVKTKLSGSISTKKNNMNGVINIPKTIGQTDYNKLINLPQIENIELKGNKTFDELGMRECSNQDILDLFK